MERKYYVYELIDPTNNRPFYVGKGHGARIYAHLYEAKRTPDKWNNALKCERINSIISKGFVPINNVIKEELTENEAFTIETRLMKKYGFIVDDTGILTNVRRNHINHNTLPERKYKSRCVVQYTLEGDIINTFPSVISAASSLKKKNKTSILNCCHGRRTTAYGYVWKFVGDPFTIPSTEIPYHINRRKSVIQKDSKGQILFTYDSMLEASRKTKVRHEAIVNCCNKKAKVAGGFYWELASRN